MFSSFLLNLSNCQNEGIGDFIRGHFHVFFWFWVFPDKHNPRFSFGKPLFLKSPIPSFWQFSDSKKNRNNYFSWNSVRSLGDIFGFIIFWNSVFLELQRRVSKGRIRKMTNLRICTVGLDHNWWFLTTFLMFCLWFSWFIAPETDSKKITKIIGILPNALELGCQKLSKKCTGINLRGKAGSRTNPEVFKIHRCLCFRVCMGQCCQRLVIKFLSRGVSLLLAAYHSQKLAQKAVGRGPPATTMSFHGDFPWFDRRRASAATQKHTWFCVQSDRDLKAIPPFLALWLSLSQ